MDLLCLLKWNYAVILIINLISVLLSIFSVYVYVIKKKKSETFCNSKSLKNVRLQVSDQDINKSVLKLHKQTQYPVILSQKSEGSKKLDLNGIKEESKSELSLSVSEQRRDNTLSTSDLRSQSLPTSSRSILVGESVVPTFL